MAEKSDFEEARVTPPDTLFRARRAWRLVRYRWWWKRTFYWPTVRAWHRAAWGVYVPPSMLAKLGRGTYVDVTRRGPYLDIEAHHDQVGHGLIRLIPYAPNHGVMVEFWQDGIVKWRTHADYGFFTRIGEAHSELNYKDVRKHLAELEDAVAPPPGKDALGG